jgi:two-component system, cell cycle response regulator DivK
MLAESCMAPDPERFDPVGSAGADHDSDLSGRSFRPLAPLQRLRRRSPRTRLLGRVLIVDDSADTRDLYSTYLDHCGYQVLTAPDGDVGIDLAVRLKPDVIVMDLAMPRINGISATHHLKHHPRTRRVPVVLLTGYAFRAIQQGALEMGVDVFLTKPCLPEDLEVHVRRLIAGRSRRGV